MKQSRNWSRSASYYRVNTSTKLELTKEFGVSRKPIREALIQIASMGLIVIRPLRGTIVAELGAQQLFEMFEANEGERMKTIFRVFSTALLLILSIDANAVVAPELVMEEFMVPAVDPGISLYVRNKHVNRRVMLRFRCTQHDWTVKGSGFHHLANRRCET